MLKRVEKLHDKKYKRDHPKQTSKENTSGQA